MRADFVLAGISDMRLSCPASTKGFVYIWSIICICIYAIGVPFLSLSVMLWFGIPQIAHSKRQIAKLKSFIATFFTAPALSQDEARADLVVINPSSHQRDVVQSSSTTERKSTVRNLMIDMLDWHVLGDVLLEKPDRQSLESMSESELEKLLATKVLRVTQRGLLHVPRATWDGGSGQLERQAIQRIGTVFLNFYVDSWWYDVSEFWRKFAITSVISVIWPGSIEQTHVGFIMCIVSQPPPLACGSKERHCENRCCCSC